MNRYIENQVKRLNQLRDEGENQKY
jgi:hypothetical protein